MKKAILSIVVTLILVSPVYAKEYQSSFGFTVDLASHWLVLDKQEVKDNPDLFDSFSEAFPNVKKNVLEHIKGLIESGRVEFYLDQRTLDLRLTDNIFVAKFLEKIPSNEQELTKFCDLAPTRLPQLLGRKVNVYACELRKVNGLNALYLDFDGVVEGTRSLQYRIQKSPSVGIMITATCANSNVERLRKEFDEIVSSMKMR